MRVSSTPWALLAGEVPGEIAEPSHVDGADLFDKNACGIASTASCGRNDAGWRYVCRRDEDDRSREQLVGLGDDTEPCRTRGWSAVGRDRMLGGRRPARRIRRGFDDVTQPLDRSL
jgi:hypothetical protein